MAKSCVIVFVGLICYLSLQKARVLEDSYGWVTTATYITGYDGAVTLLCFFYLSIFGIVVILYGEQISEEKANNNSNVSEAKVTSKYSCLQLMLFSARIFCFVKSADLLFLIFPHDGYLGRATPS